MRAVAMVEVSHRVKTIESQNIYEVIPSWCLLKPHPEVNLEISPPVASMKLISFQTNSTVWGKTSFGDFQSLRYTKIHLFHCSPKHKAVKYLAIKTIWQQPLHVQNPWPWEQQRCYILVTIIWQKNGHPTNKYQIICAYFTISLKAPTINLKYLHFGSKSNDS